MFGNKVFFGIFLYLISCLISVCSNIFVKKVLCGDQSDNIGHIRGLSETQPIIRKRCLSGDRSSDLRGNADQRRRSIQRLSAETDRICA